MSEQTPRPDHSPGLLHRLRQAGALGLSLAVGAVGVHFWDSHTSADQADQALTAIGDLYGVQPQDITGEGLPTIPARHGPQDRVTAAERHELQQATVAVLEGSPGDRFWEGDGTGTKVAYDGHDYVLTALHLFNSNYTEPLKPRAADELTGDSMVYAIADPRLSNEQQDYSDDIFGKVTGAAFLELANVEAPDIVLARIKPLPPAPGAKRRFQGVDAIPMAEHLLSPPQPGEPVWMYGVPSPTTNPHATGGFGTYLGRAMVPGPEDNVEKVDIVGVETQNASDDVCEHGHSGQSFIAGNGFVSGPVFYRAPTVSEQVPFGEQTGAVRATAASIRWEIQKALHANLNAYTVLCAFSVLEPTWPKELVKGFGVKEDPYR